jgi:hypothetical protein
MILYIIVKEIEPSYHDLLCAKYENYIFVQLAYNNYYFAHNHAFRVFIIKLKYKYYKFCFRMVKSRNFSILRLSAIFVRLTFNIFPSPTGHMVVNFGFCLSY